MDGRALAQGGGSVGSRVSRPRLRCSSSRPSMERGVDRGMESGSHATGGGNPGRALFAVPRGQGRARNSVGRRLAPNHHLLPFFPRPPLLSSRMIYPYQPQQQTLHRTLDPASELEDSDGDSEVSSVSRQPVSDRSASSPVGLAPAVWMPVALLAHPVAHPAALSPLCRSVPNAPSFARHPSVLVELTTPSLGRPRTDVPRPQRLLLSPRRRRRKADREAPHRSPPDLVRWQALPRAAPTARCDPRHARAGRRQGPRPRCVRRPTPVCSRARQAVILTPPPVLSCFVSGSGMLGAWTIGMADEFPLSQCIGLDLVPNEAESVHLLFTSPSDVD